MKIKARDEAFNCYWRWQQELEGRWARILETRVVYCCLVPESRRPYIRSRTQGLIQADLKGTMYYSYSDEGTISDEDEDGDGWAMSDESHEKEEHGGISQLKKPGGIRSRRGPGDVRSRTYGPIISCWTPPGQADAALLLLLNCCGEAEKRDLRSQMHGPSIVQQADAVADLSI